ncbi:MAG: TrkH family potassium uptake protein [Lentisphaerae bacterium]|nr:MAG: TrkH family potassium uptake protein [Lentisphaerota bacterium]
MYWQGVLKTISGILGVVGCCMLTSVPVGWLMGDHGKTLMWMTIASLIPLCLGIAGSKSIRRMEYRWGFREGFGIATFGWILTAAAGALPFVLIADLTWTDAYFESMSGFTTTGASIISPDLRLRNGSFLTEGLESLPACLLYWRSMTHWLGGMGIVVLSVAILPFLGIGSQAMVAAEVPGPTSDNITPRIADSAKILWGVYILLSIMETILLMAGGMSLFDAWCHTCGTMATGGFSTRAASVGAFRSAYIDWVITLFMFLAGCNFVLHFQALKGRLYAFWKDEEFRFYLFVILVGSLIVCCSLWLRGDPIEVTTGEKIEPTLSAVLRFGAFQVVSLITTTGFCTANFDCWAPDVRILLVVFMFFGGCGGSTGGGIKHSRIILGLKYILQQIRRSLFPHHLTDIRLNGKRVSNHIVHRTLGFIIQFVCLFILGALLVGALPGFDSQTAVTASIACLGNIGPGLGKVGAICTYAWIPWPGKWLLCFLMLLGRLELYTVMVVFLPSFWRR